VADLASGNEFEREALSALSADDWYGAYSWAKGWIGRGGGAWIVDPWLVYAASALIHGQPRTAVHSLDLALANWITDRQDRSILLWVRGTIVRLRLEDPKTAQADFDAAASDTPDWLRPSAEASREACAREAERSRKRKATVKPAPPHRGPQSVHETVAPPSSHRAPGTRPPVWDAVMSKVI